MIDAGVIYTFWSAMGTTITGAIYWIYTKYQQIRGDMADRPTKDEIQAMLEHEADKLNPRLDSIERSIQELHGDVQLLLNYILNAPRTPPEKSGKPTTPDTYH